MNLIYDGHSIKREISQVFSETMKALFEKDPKVIYLDADLMGSLKTQDLWKDYPNNVFNCGIQEANMIGVSAGLYLSGFKPYVHTFAPFATRRVFDQIFLSLGYANKSVRIIGSDAGIAATYNGGTHMCFEDIAIMRTIPEACVIDVTDARMFEYLLSITKDREGVTYFRTSRRGLLDIYDEKEIFNIGKGKILKDGNDVTIIACGMMVSTSLEAAKILEEKGISTRVVDIVTIKPLDYELLEECAIKTKAIVTVENHNILGGLGSSICEYLSEKQPIPIGRVGKISFSYRW